MRECVRESNRRRLNTTCRQSTG